MEGKGRLEMMTKRIGKAAPPGARGGFRDSDCGGKERRRSGDGAAVSLAQRHQRRKLHNSRT